MLWKWYLSTEWNDPKVKGGVNAVEMVFIDCLG